MIFTTFKCRLSLPHSSDHTSCEELSSLYRWNLLSPFTPGTHPTMGIRHQFFVIAKIGSRYRGLAARNHQYLEGGDARTLCLPFLEIFQSSENRLALEHELRWAKTISGSDWQTKGEYAAPSPFILTCLSIGSFFHSGRVLFFQHPLV